MATIIYLKKCESTNDAILPFLAPHLDEMMSVYTFNQTKGKGQYGNSWEFSESMNVAFSLAMGSNHFKLPDHLLNFHTAVLLGDFLAKMTKIPISIKWPNDIIIRNKKVAGLLVEKKNIRGNTYFIIGIGLNVLQQNFDHLPKAGSLLTQAGLECNLEDLTLAIHEFLCMNLPRAIKEECLLDKLNQQLFRKEVVSVFEIKGLRQNGIIKEVDTKGFLWVDLENDGLQKFFHKEIELLY